LILLLGRLVGRGEQAPSVLDHLGRLRQELQTDSRALDGSLEPPQQRCGEGLPAVCRIWPALERLVRRRLESGSGRPAGPFRSGSPSFKGLERRQARISPA